jgi:hypothetical protein
MELNLPGWATDWKTAFFTAERRLSPRLEQAVGTDTVLDALTVANSVGRLAQLQYSIDRLVDAQQSRWAGRREPTPPS